MRILHVAYAFPPILNIADGITNVAYHITRELARRGHAVHVYTSNAWNLNDRRRISEKELLLEDNLHVRYLNYLFRWGTFFFTPSITKLLAETTARFDIMHIHDARSFQGIAAYHFASKQKIPYVFQPHGSFLPLSFSSMKRKIFGSIVDRLTSERIVRNASRLLTLSENEAEEYEALGIPKNKIVTVPNGLDLSEFRVLPPRGVSEAKSRLGHAKRIILYLGRVHKTKGIDFLIRAYAYALKDSIPADVALVVAGPDDGYLDSAKSLARLLKIADKVIFTGLLTESEKRHLLVDSDLVVYPSRAEPFGLVTLEAAASAKPVIVSRSTPMASIVESGRFGFSVEYGDIRDLATLLGNVIGDEKSRERLGNNGRQYVFNHFGWKKITAKLEHVYQSVVSSPNV